MQAEYQVCDSQEQQGEQMLRDMAADDEFTVHIETTHEYKATSVDLITEKDGKMYVVFKRGIIPVKNGAGTNAKGTYSGSLNAVLDDGKKVRVKEIYYGTQKEHVLLWSACN